MTHLPAIACGCVPFVALAAASRLRKSTGTQRVLGALLHRTAWILLTVLLVFTASFFLMRATPGGPFDSDRSLAPEVRARLESRYGLDRPVVEQYLRALDGLASFDLGPSLVLRDFSVGDVILQGLPPSLLLGVAALAWTLLLGVPAGIAAALGRGRRLVAALDLSIALALAIPGFVLAGVLMMPLVFAWRLFPAAGLASAGDLVLPSFCLGLPFAAQVARLVRTGLLEVLGQDWIRTARAKGLSEQEVILGHALRGALVPVVAWMGPALAGILTGSLVIEQVFGIPGVGTHFVQSALNRDYTLAMGMVLLYTFAICVSNALADALHAALDPRVRFR